MTATILEFPTMYGDAGMSDEKVELKAGDVVKLKSFGSPEMTVGDVVAAHVRVSGSKAKCCKRVSS
jgi:uncharacterized protein YodC (DUF2158 family)